MVIGKRLYIKQHEKLEKTAIRMCHTQKEQQVDSNRVHDAGRGENAGGDGNVIGNAITGTDGLGSDGIDSACDDGVIGGDVGDPVGGDGAVGDDGEPVNGDAVPGVDVGGGIDVVVVVGGGIDVVVVVVGGCGGGGAVVL
ncbi:Hypothetical predicted protein [Octopus vulgaris]|uniref:Uncharacterized protein n=1 Tax=Octopus vulgaris TaxID=6645 RepID=A0AA36HHY2_OCTVU|nr:Hypothetical predicted protein [Octopus vulgaris]